MWSQYSRTIPANVDTTDGDYGIQIPGPEYMALVDDALARLQALKKYAEYLHSQWYERDLTEAKNYLLYQFYKNYIEEDGYIGRYTLCNSTGMSVYKVNKTKRIRDKIDGSVFKQLLYSFGFLEPQYEDVESIEVKSYDEFMNECITLLDKSSKEEIFNTIIEFQCKNGSYNWDWHIGQREYFTKALEKRVLPAPMEEVTFPDCPPIDNVDGVYFSKYQELLDTAKASLSNMPSTAIFSVPQSFAVKIDKLIKVSDNALQLQS